MKKSRKLITLKEVDSLCIDQIRKIYKSHVSKTQSDLFMRFKFGSDLIASASGCYLTTKEGTRILDATGGIGVLNHGHNHPRILKARTEFANKSSMEVHKAFHSPYLAALSANVSALLPEALTHSYFPNSGAEAVESAMKMAYKYHNGKRNVVLHSSISFHGKLFGSGSVTGSSEINFKFPTISGADSFKYNDIEDFRLKIKEHARSGSSDVYAVLIEPFNVSSMNSCDSDYLIEVREICNQNDIVLIFDEVYSGWCKTGDLFFFMRTPNLVPDILCYAKSFGGGKASISGITAKERIYTSAYDNPDDVMLQSTTYYGFGEECITAIEALQIIVDDDYVSKSKMLEESFSRMLYELKANFPEEIPFIRGAGALWALKLGKPSSDRILNLLRQITPYRGDTKLIEKLTAAAVIDYCYREHEILLFMSANQDTLLKISFPLIATQVEVDKVQNALDSCFSIGLDKVLFDFLKQNLKQKLTGL